MKVKILIAFIAALVIIACNKGKFQTRPTLKLRSISTNILPVGGTLNISLEYTDKEGDLGGDTLLSIRTRSNRRPIPPTTVSPDYLHNYIPEFPKKIQGQFEVKLGYGYLHQSDIENDTIILRFIAKDNAGNISDTVTTGKIVVLKP